MDYFKFIKRCLVLFIKILFMELVKMKKFDNIVLVNVWVFLKVSYGNVSWCNFYGGLFGNIYKN